MKKVIVGALPLALITLIPNVAEAFDFSGLYVFGDSLSDTGNLYQATGNQIPPSAYYFDGRLSNGPLWVEYLAPKLNLTYTQQTNFAFAGATTGITNTTSKLIPGNPPLPGLQQEVAVFSLLNPVSDPNGLYIVWAGANDYVGGGETNPFIPVANITAAIQTLVGTGAKTILVPNLPDLGKLPGTRIDPVVSAALTALSTSHNTLLAQSLSLLNTNLGPAGVNLVPLDVFSLLNDAFANPGTYGFTNTTQSCLFPPPLLSPGTTPTICSNPDQYVFWDDIHPTTATHAEIGNFAYETLSASAVPEPSATAGMVLAGAFLGAIATLKRKRQKSLPVQELAEMAGKK